MANFRIAFAVTSADQLTRYNSRSNDGTLALVKALTSKTGKLYAFNAADSTWNSVTMSTADVNALIAAFYAQKNLTQPFVTTAAASELVAGKALFPTSTNAVTLLNGDIAISISTAFTVAGGLPDNAAIQIGYLPSGANPTFTALYTIPAYYLTQVCALKWESEGIDSPTTTTVIPANASLIVKIINVTPTAGSIEVSGQSYGN